MRIPTSITTGTNILKLDPGIYYYEDSSASDEQKLAMGFPKGIWHAEITVTGYWNETEKKTGYLNIRVVDCSADPVGIYINNHSWNAWNGWEKYTFDSQLNEYALKNSLSDYLLKSSFTSQITGNIKIGTNDDRSSSEIISSLSDGSLYCFIANGNKGISAELNNTDVNNAYIVFIYKGGSWRIGALAIPMDGVAGSNTNKLYVGQCNGASTVKWKSVA